jgi:cyclophilin family peptidyl-prolyl cis-trans isomerase
MHSLDYMPHAVHLFVEQVAHGLWDNTHFFSNAPHILFISPAHTIESIPLNLSRIEEFEHLGLKNLLFQEYHEKYPHTPMTLGFSGRPAGPQFYINKIDNSIIHGPGGQVHHRVDDEADPCFATVVSGKEILSRIFTLPVKQGAEYMLFEPVRIIRAVVHADHETVVMAHDGSLSYHSSSLETNHVAHQGEISRDEMMDRENSNHLPEAI